MRKSKLLKRLSAVLTFSTALCSTASAQSIGSGEISEFNTFQLQYSAPFDAIDKGAYGFLAEVFDYSGFGVAFGVEANMGLVDPSSVSAKIGPTYGVALSKNVAISCPLMLSVGYTPLSYEDKQYLDDVSEWGVGGQLMPKIIFKPGKFSVSAGIPINYNGSSQDFKAGVMFGIGYDFDF